MTSVHKDLIEEAEKLLNEEYHKFGAWEHLSTTKYNGQCTIYRRSTDSGLYEYYVRGYFENISAQHLFAIGMDLDYRKNWDQFCLELSVIEDQEEHQWIHWGCKFPWPLKNRDYVFCRKGKKLEDNKYILVSKGGTHPKKAEDRSYIRVDTYTLVNLIRQENNQCHFGLLYYDDMKGSIPKSIVNWAISTAVPEFLKKTYEACQKYPSERLKQFE